MEESEFCKHLIPKKEEIENMIAKIGKMMTKREDKSFSYEELAAMLKTSPEALETFEGTYKRQVLDSGALSENFLQWEREIS